MPRTTTTRWCAVAVVVLGLASARARAQQPPPAQPPQVDRAELARDQRIEALEAALAKQAAELAALREALETQQAAAGDDAPSGEDEAALAALLADAQADAEVATTDEPSLRLYGFADVGLQRIWAHKGLSVLTTESSELTFVLGNVNLYLDAQVSRNWRFLAEVRFGLGPNGAVPRPGGGFVLGAALDTSVSDPTAANGAFSYVRWAGVVPQRAHIDWTPSDAFNLRAGLFLNPYGIWNVDHGTPTRIMASEPLFLSTQLVPNQLVGVEAYGTLPVLPWTVGYHFHVSNGRTMGQVDLTDNKAVGGRLFLSTRDPYPIKLGLSGYWGTFEAEERTIALRRTVVEYTERSLSCDVSLDIGALRIRSELIANWTIYEDGKRPVVLGVTLADTVRVGSYAMVAYQLPWWGIEPMVMFEWIRLPTPRSLPVGQGVVMPSGGVNLYFTATTMLRTQFATAHGVDLSENPVKGQGWLFQGVARLITAF